MEETIKGTLRVLALGEGLIEERWCHLKEKKERIEKGLALAPNLSFWQDPIVGIWKFLLNRRKNSLLKRIENKEAEIAVFLSAEDKLRRGHYGPAIDLLKKIMATTPPEFHGEPTMNLEKNSVPNPTFYDLGRLMEGLTKLKKTA